MFLKRSIWLKARKLAGLAALPEEMLGALPDKEDERDYLHPIPAASRLVTKHSLKPYAGPVRDQGRTSACTGMATAAAVEIIFARARMPVTVSPAWIYWHARARAGLLGEDGGAYPRDAVASVTKQGVIAEHHMYHTSPMTPPSDEAKQASWLRLRNYERIPHSSDTGFSVRSVLCIDQLPVLLSFRVFEKQIRSPSLRFSGYFDMPDKDDKSVSRHMVVLTGFRRVPGTHKYEYEFLNSWGFKWGSSGYGWLHEDWFSSEYYCPDIWTFDKSLW